MHMDTHIVACVYMYMYMYMSVCICVICTYLFTPYFIKYIYRCVYASMPFLHLHMF